ncbi:MAG: FxLYD domain-containing protein [bacterium]|nr:FxLYD domain-containing protein [bacterium]
MRRLAVLGIVLTTVLVAGVALAQKGQGPSSEAVRHYTAGMRLLERGALEAAEAELERAVRLAPDYFEALSSLALVYRKRGKMTHYRAFLKSAAAVKAKQSVPQKQPTPSLAPPAPPGPAPPPKKPEQARPTRAERNRWRHEGPEPKEVFVTEREVRRGPLGNLRIEGTVKNNTSKAVERVVVALVAFSADGRPVDPPLTYRGPWELNPGEQASFSLDVADTGDKVERFDLKASWGPPVE